LLAYRHDLVTQLGTDYFSQSLICKEIGEITDVRSWAEREEGQDEACRDGCKDCDGGNGGGVKDLGYRRNKCRLCDRRMQNPISPEALAVLKTLNQQGSLVVLVRLSPLFAPFLPTH
jgi:twinfilin-like protein